MPIHALRDYQLEYKQQVFQFFSNPENKSVLLVMPTGTGKTTVFSSLTYDWLALGYRTLIAVHRIELVDQIIERLNSFGVSAGVIGGDYELQLDLPVQVGMIQSLPEKMSWRPDYIVIDECHHSVANSYQSLWKLFPLAKIMGVTATPIRLDGRGFSDLYQSMINLYNLKWFIERNYLVKPIHYFCANIPPEHLKISGEDYSVALQSKYLNQKKALTDIVQSYMNYCAGRKAVVFAASVQHSKDLVRRFNEMGIPSAHLCGQVPKEERARIVAGFRSGIYLVLVNYDIVSEGFDVPDIEAVILARRSKSLSFYIQCIGRALRTFNGKDNGYVLDCAGQWLEHGFAGIEYNWSLDMTKQSVIQSITQQKLFLNSGKKFKTLASDPEELLGFNLVAADQELERTGMFEKFLYEHQKDKDTSESALKAFNVYRSWMEWSGHEWTMLEVRYIQNQLRKYNIQFPTDIIKSIQTAA